MQFEPITRNDLAQISKLRPDDWPDIVPDFEYYLRSPFCYPIKTSLKERIVGIGTLIDFGATCWLAHIIVDKEFRKRGIGRGITLELMDMAKKRSIPTCLLIASDMGHPVYEKVGFRMVTEYIPMKKEKLSQDEYAHDDIVPFREEYRAMIHSIDRNISGEDRSKLLREYLDNAKVYLDGSTVKGYYIPDLKQGPIYAETREAGLALMKLKYTNTDIAVIPVDNIFALDYLKQNGFEDVGRRATRMVYGKDIVWEPEKIYGRIGGNLG